MERLTAHIQDLFNPTQGNRAVAASNRTSAVLVLCACVETAAVATRDLGALGAVATGWSVERRISAE